MAAAPPRLASPLPRIGGNYAIQSSDTPTTRHQPASNAAKPPPQPASCAASPTRPGRRADWRDNVATLKPTTPLLAPNKGPLKPPSPLHPKTAPKKPISHPQRRWRFQSHTDTSEQRRWRFQATGPTGMQAAGGAAGPGYGTRGQRQSLAGLRGDAQAHVSTPGPTGVEAAGGAAGPGCGARGRWRGLAGLRGAAPNEVRTPSLAGGRALRRPEHPWGHTAARRGTTRQRVGRLAAPHPSTPVIQSAITPSPAPPTG